MPRRFEPLFLALVLCGIVAGYFWISRPAAAQFGLLEPSQQHFNQLVAGFRSGQLSLKEEPAPELATLADPYDPVQNAPYRLHDASYYHGKYYIYFGVTPALVLFWPYVAITGQYLPQKDAVAIFCSAAFLIGAALIWHIRRIYFPKVGAGVFLAMVVAFGTVSGAAFLARRPEMYEVSISCAFAMIMAALASLWCSLNSLRRPLAWTVLSSLFFGLAVGARPTFLFGAAALLIPVIYHFKARANGGLGRHSEWKVAVAAFAPLALIGIGLAGYNYLRFGSPLEFGIKYLMIATKLTSYFSFNWRCVLLNARLYFISPTRLMGYFPFVLGVTVPPLPPGYVMAENPFGVIPNIPFLLMAGVAPLAFLVPGKSGMNRLRLFAGALAWLAVSSVAVLLVFAVACIRYEVDFAPYLALLAVLGVFGVEEYYSTRHRCRNLARVAWGGALLVSVAFNFFGSCQHLDILRKDSPGEYQALSRFFDQPIYAYNHNFAPARSRPRADTAQNEDRMPDGYGPIQERIDVSNLGDAREPLLVIGKTKETTFIAFVRKVGKDQISVGFEFPGIGAAECKPITIAPNAPVAIAVLAPPMLPDLGDREWGAVSYRRQLSDLGAYTITVNGVGALQIISPLNKPIERDAPFSIATNPVKGSSVAQRFGGQIVNLSRLSIGGFLPER